MRGLARRREALDKDVVVRVVEEGDGQPRSARAIGGGRVHDTVEVGQPAVVGPAHQQVADIHDELGRSGVDVDPVPGPGPHLEPARNVLAAQDGEAPIVGVGAGRYLNPDLPDRAGLSRSFLQSRGASDREVPKAIIKSCNFP
jgi:hypothetical protein